MTRTSRSFEEIVGAVLQAPVEDVVDEATPETIKSWNSLNHVQVVIALEEAFGVRFSAQEISSVRRIADFRRVLRKSGITS
jgi:acyl carrier protein